MLLSHSGGSPFLAADGTLIAELGESDDTLLIEPIGAEAIRITINSDVHEFARNSVLGISVTAGGGDDRVEVSSSLDIPAVLAGGAGSDTLIGGAVADVLDGGADADSLVGDDGEDAFKADPLDPVDGGPGIDSLTLVITGSDDADSIRIENVDDVTTRVTINGTTHDYVRYEFTSAEIAAGTGDDLVEVLADVTVNVQVFGDAGNDTLIGGAGNDTLDGGAGVDSFAAGTGDDWVFAEHSESIDTGSGADSLFLSIDGTDSDDVIEVQNLDLSTVRLTLNASTFDFPRAELRSVEIQVHAGNDLVELGTDVEFVGNIFGGDGDDTLTGGPHADAIDGGLGNDSISGGDGGDVLVGSDGFDMIDGGAGDDSIEGGVGDDSLSGGEGFDTIWGDDGSDTVTGGDDDDVLGGGLPDGYGTDLVDGADLVLGGAGNDTLSGAAGADTLRGEDGDDSVAGGADADVASGGDGRDTIASGTGDDTLAGDAGDDVLDGGAGVDSIDGGFDEAGVEFDVLIVFGSDGADAITAAPDEAGNALVTVSAETDTATSVEYLEVLGLGGDDLLTIDLYLEVDVSLSGGDGNDTLVGGHGFDILDGGAGNDSMNGRDGFDIIRFLGSDDADAISVSIDLAGHVQISLGGELDTADDVQKVFVNAAEGDDSIVASFEVFAPEILLWFEGRGGADTLVGGPWSDLLYGGGGADSLVGGGGDDILLGASGDDTLDAGDGNDSVLGTTGDDSILGGPGNDTLSGGDGFDTITGDDGDDSIEGGADDDSIDGGAGSDTMVGGEGDDTIDGASGDDNGFGGLGRDLISGGDGNDTIGSNEGNDTFFGGNGDDQISGGADDDVLDGGEGSDLLDGGSGRDNLIGGDRSRPHGERVGCDNDTLVGAADDDTLDGGRGRDRLDGGPGTNDLIADSRRDTIVPGAGTNRIQPIRKTDNGTCGGVVRSAVSGRHRHRRNPLSNAIDAVRHRNRQGATSADLTPRPTAIAPFPLPTERANLVLTTTTSVISVRSAQVLVYFHSIRNLGPRRADYVTLYDTFPETAAVLARTAIRGNGDPGSCTLDAENNMVCDLNRLRDNGETATVSVEAVADANEGSNLNNTANTQSFNIETYQPDNSSANSNSVTSPFEGVTIAAVDRVGGETGADSAQFVIRRNEIRNTTLTVQFHVEGTATQGTATQGDYQLVGNSGNTVVIPANQDSVTITVTVRDDPDVEPVPPETVTITLENGTGYLTSQPDSDTITIRDNDVPPPTVTITAADHYAYELGLDPGRFEVCRTPVAAAPLDVYFTVLPNVVPGATPGVDYTALPSRVTIEPNRPCADIVVRPLQDTLIEDVEFIRVVLDPQATYVIGTTDYLSVYVELTSDDLGPDVVRISASDPVAAEQNTDPGRFEICRNQTQSNLAVNFTTTAPPGSSATNGADYTLTPSGSSVQVPTGQQCAPVTVNPINDTDPYEGLETVVVTVNPGSGYTVAPPPANQATVFIYDKDCDPVRVRSVAHNVADGVIYSGDSFTLTARTRPANPAAGHGTYTWEFHELLTSGRGLRQYGPWQPATGSPVAGPYYINTLVTTASRSGQYRSTLASCGITTSALISVQVQDYRINATAYRPQTVAFKWWEERHAVPEEGPLIFGNNEQDPGAGIRINGDDDNHNNVPDRDDTCIYTQGPGYPNSTPYESGDDDLILVKLEASPVPAPRRTRYQLVTDHSLLRFWDSPTKCRRIREGDIQFWNGTREIWVEFPGPNHGVDWLIFRRVDDRVGSIQEDRIRFFSFTSVVVALGGEDQTPEDPARPNFGTFQIAIDLYDRAYDVHMFDEDVVDPREGTTDVGKGQAYDEILSAVRNRAVEEIAIFGYSHGGGATRDLAERVNTYIAGRGAEMQFTGYIDAIENTGPLTDACETRRPPGTLHHANYFQILGGRVILGLADLTGCSVGGSHPNLNVTRDTTWGRGLDHFTIDDSVNVRTDMMTELIDNTNR